MIAFSFENIIAWQKAHQFACRVYEVTKIFPEDEKFGLTSQFRRAAISIGANIAEGYRKLSKADKLRFLNISEGSLAECQNYIVLSKDLGYISYNDYECLCNMSIEVAKLIIAYSKGIINNNGIN
ncbi:MAG: four helix bundle protein [Bacteroidaceae bacterium]|nr:four helix bundle protein [Bacteroidaceae bacterium]